MQMHTIRVDNPQSFDVVMGHIPLVKTAEKIHTTLVHTLPDIKFGLAFTEPSAPAIVKHFGTDQALIELARKNAGNIGVGKTFVLFSESAGPLKVMNALRQVPDIQKIYCATSCEVEVIVVESDGARDVMGLVDDHAAVDERYVHVVKKHGGFFGLFG